MKKLIIFALLLAAVLSAQTTPATPPPSITPDPLPATAPTFLLGASVGISPYATGTKYSGLGTFAVRIPGSNLWSWSTLQMIPGQTAGALLSTGAAYTVKVQGPWSITALATAGVATGSTVTLGTFSGGGVIAYQVSVKQNLYVTAGLTIQSISGNTVAPSFGIGFAKGF